MTGWGAQLYLVIGPEDFLADRAVRSVVDKAREHFAQPVDVRDVQAADLTPGVLAGYTTPSLFEEPSVVVVRELQDGPETLAADVAGFLADPPATCVVVLVHSGVAKGKKLLDGVRKAAGTRLAEVQCRDIKGRRDKLRFLREEFRDIRRKASDEAMEAILDALGGDLRTLAGAVSQLAADTSGLIELDTVHRYYSGRAEVSGFMVSDRALEGRTAEALEQLRWSLHAGNDPVPLLAALASGLRGLVAVGSAPRGLSAADVARHAGMPPWKVDVVRRQLRGWSQEGIACSIRAVAAADAQIKGAGTDPVYALERAVITISKARD